MSNEPGERRRRRELERARELAVQAAVTPEPAPAEPAPATPTPAKPVPAKPAPPVSRRERRELERATELATSVGPEAAQAALVVPSLVPEVVERPRSAPIEPHVLERPARQPSSRESAPAPRVAPAPPTPTAAAPIAPVHVPPAQVPPAPAPRVPAALSRRAMRNAAGPVESVRTPVVHPPTTTGTIRSVAPAQEPAALRPAGATASADRGYPPVAPRRASVLPYGVSAVRPTPPVYPAAARPATARPASDNLAAPESTTREPKTLDSAPRETSTAEPTSEETRFTERATPGSPPSPRVAPPSDAIGPAVASGPPVSAAPGSGAAWSPLTDIPVPPPGRNGFAPPPVDASVGAPLAPRWGNVPPGSFDAITRPNPDDGAGASVAADSSDAEAAAPAARARRWAYTWLQVLALALVAFVLGFLVWLLYIRGSAEPSAADAFALQPSTSSSAISSPHLGEP